MITDDGLFQLASDGEGCRGATVSKLTLPAAPICLRTTVTLRSSVPLENAPIGGAKDVTVEEEQRSGTDSLCTVVGIETRSTMSLVDRTKQVRHLSLYIIFCWRTKCIYCDRYRSSADAVYPRQNAKIWTGRPDWLDCEIISED